MDCQTSSGPGSTIDLMTMSQKEAMSSALFNPLILYKIINNLDYPELLICRGVSPDFENVSSELMLKRDCSVIKILYNYHKLIQLNQILSKSENFPSSSVTIRWGNFGSAQVRKFFQIYGRRIKTLKLTQDNPGLTSKKSFCELLLHLVPNLECLELKNFEFKNWTENEQLFMPTLKELKGIHSDSTILHILSISPNLQTLHDVDMAIVKKAGKVNLVHEFTWWDKFLLPVDYLTTFSNLEPKLKKICLYHDSHISVIHPDAITGINKLLESSKDTLTSLDLTYAYLTTPRLVFPKLPNVTTLTLVRLSVLDLLPIEVNLPRTFRNLQILDLSYFNVCSKEGTWPNVFSSLDLKAQELPSVQILKINYACSDKWVSGLLDLCPNFTRAVIAYFDPSIECDILSKVFQFWPHLQSLEIIVEKIVQNLSLEDPLDSPLTGMTRESCQRLRRQPGEEWEDACENLIMGPSIRNLKELTSLTFRLGKTEPKVPISRVSGIYAFKLMPRLKVALILDHLKLDTEDLDSLYKKISPYANIRHEKEN